MPSTRNTRSSGKQAKPAGVTRQPKPPRASRPAREKPKPKPKPKAQPKPKPKAQTQPKPKPKAQTQPRPKAQPPPRPRTPGESRAVVAATARVPVRSVVPPPLGKLPDTLKEAKRLIQDRERAGAVMSHQLGKLYAHVLRKELYREDDHEDFWKWVAEVMGRTRGYVQKLLSMVNVFPSEKEVSKIGAHNARIIATVADEKVRKRLVDAAKKGAPIATIERRVQRFRDVARESKGTTRKRGRAVKYIEVEELLRFRRTLEIEKPVKLAEGVTVELRQVGLGRFRLCFERSN